MGEGPHHTAVEARELGIVILYAGHYATETLGVRALGDELAKAVRRDVDIHRRAERAVTRGASDRAASIVLSLSNITKRFGTSTAVDDVSFDVRAGTVHALLGENGAGKTTLMRIAFGLLAAGHGSMYESAEHGASRRPPTRSARGIGMVHQHFTNVPAMTVAENVALGGPRPIRQIGRGAARGELGVRTRAGARCRTPRCGI